MAHVIEVAKSGRAACRKCKEKIAKDDLRFGHEVPNAFADGEMTHQWLHLKCAAQKHPAELAEALADYTGDVPGRAELETLLQEHLKKAKVGEFPYAEPAPTGRSSCLACGEKIEKGALRVAVEREVDAGGMMRKSAGYLHPRCCSEYEDLPDNLLEQLRANSSALTPEQLDELAGELEG